MLIDGWPYTDSNVSFQEWGKFSGPRATFLLKQPYGSHMSLVGEICELYLCMIG